MFVYLGNSTLSNSNRFTVIFDFYNPNMAIFLRFQEVNSKPIQRILDYFYNDPWTNELTNMLSQLDYVRVRILKLFIFLFKEELLFVIPLTKIITFFPKIYSHYFNQR
jgi:hypothetical protein